MSPSIRWAGTIDRLRAVLAHRAIYEIGGELDVRADIGRPPSHPPYVLLLFATLARITRSTVRVETDLADPAHWELVRALIVETLHREHLDLPAPGPRPPAWHHWRRFRDEHLATDEGILRLRQLHLPRAVALAHDTGLLLPGGAGSFTHPDKTRAVYGDGTIVRPIYTPPEAVRTRDANGNTVVLYPDPATGELTPNRPERRFDPDTADHHGHTGPVHGHGYVAFHARGPARYQRVVLTIDHIDAPGQEAATALRLIGDLHRALGDGIQVVVYDGAFRGVHIDQIMTRHGYLVIAKLPDHTLDDTEATARLVRLPGARRARSHPLGIITHDTIAGPCNHLLAAVNGVVVELDLDDAGDPVIRHELDRGAVKRSRRKDGRHHFNVGYHIPCRTEPFITWLSPHASKDGNSRPEHLRVLPDADPDTRTIRGIRSDAESNHSQYKRTLLTDRAMSLGWRRGLIDYYAYGWYSNALTEFHALPAAPGTADRSTRRRATARRSVQL